MKMSVSEWNIWRFSLIRRFCALDSPSGLWFAFYFTHFHVFSVLLFALRCYVWKTPLFLFLFCSRPRRRRRSCTEGSMWYVITMQERQQQQRRVDCRVGLRNAIPWYHSEICMMIYSYQHRRRGATEKCGEFHLKMFPSCCWRASHSEWKIFALKLDIRVSSNTLTGWRAEEPENW